MLRNFVTVALRNLWRNKLYTFINILGLGIGLATMVWAWQNYRFSASFDSMHPYPENTFRVDIYGPVVLAVLIFLVCCVNFANTTVARSNRRLKEMDIRKVMGGTQRQLIWQMLLECGFITALAVFVAIEINEYWLPAYNEMWPYLDLSTDYLSDPGLLIFLIGLAVITTLLAGSYPAFYISRFNPSVMYQISV